MRDEQRQTPQDVCGEASLDWGNNNFARASRIFVHFFAVLYDAKMPNFAFMENVDKRRGNFVSLSELGYGFLEFNFRRLRLHLSK